MARIGDAELERLKADVSVLRLIEGAGIALIRRGKDFAACCPFHEEDTASLIVTPEKNLFHCFGCGAAGGPIDWVMKRNGVSFRHAVELLREGLPAITESAVGRTTVRALPPPVAFDADDRDLLNQVAGYYHETLKQSPEALAYLAARGLSHPELIDRFRLGYANRTLGLRLPEKTRKAGAEIRSRLERIGIYRETGHEHFNGSLVVPILDEGGNVVELYGRKILDNLRAGTPKHLYLPGPHRGVWNLDGIAASGGEIILTEALIDAMSFWSAGYRNVTACYGVEGFTPDHLATFRQHGVVRVLIAFDRDPAGERGSAELSERLREEGIECYRIEFPKGMDANDYALKVTPASKSLGVLIRKAAWLGQGRAPIITSAPRDELDSALGPSAETSPSSLAADLPEPVLATPLPPAPADDAVEMASEHELMLIQGDRRYRVRGWKKPLNPESLKINLLVQRGERFHIDMLDLYSAKARAAFVKQAGIELGEAEDTLKHDLGRVLLKLEALQEAEIAASLVKNDRPALSETERAEALALLRAPDLVDRILAAFESCGVVGEATNTLVGYLAAVSRLLDKPLAVIIQSSSAAGKSSLMDAVLALMPKEAQLRYSAMTGQSLFYMGETNLKHRILAIAEEEGATSASYALKLLQSEGEVTIASTGKDPTTGLLVTHEYRVEGPVMLFLTTTAIDIDEELMNRCLVLSVNESREQTRAIHMAQRERQTLAGLLAEAERDAVAALHRNAQGLLEGLKVVNPFADRLTFLDDKTRTRRDHMKYLTLIRAIALLHQHQRPIRTVVHRGQAIRYIEVEPRDIALANKLAHEVLGRTLDELPPQTRRLLAAIQAMVAEQARTHGINPGEVRFSRADVRRHAGLSDTQCRLHLDRLATLEYLLVHRGKRGQSFEYELLFDGAVTDGVPHLAGLIEADTLRSADMTASSRGDEARFAGPSRAQNAPNAASSRPGPLSANPVPARDCAETPPEPPESPFPHVNGTGSSYHHPLAANL
jgi:DNA primase catalytic core